MVLKDPNEDQDDILRANRSREKQYIFDCAFGPNSNQVSKVIVYVKLDSSDHPTGVNRWIRFSTFSWIKQYGFEWWSRSLCCVIE